MTGKFLLLLFPYTSFFCCLIYSGVFDVFVSCASVHVLGIALVLSHGLVACLLLCYSLSLSLYVCIHAFVLVLVCLHLVVV